MARPEKWKDEYTGIAERAAKAGLTDREIAEVIGISERTLHYWKHDHPELAAALKVGKEVADDRVEQSLYRRAVGYSHDAEKIIVVDKVVQREPFTEHYPPDTAAAIFWLKNRRKDEWRDKRDPNEDGEGDSTVRIEGGLPDDDH